MSEGRSTDLSTAAVDKSPAALVLAAGRGSRMGTVKALMPWRGRTLLEAWVDRFREAGCGQIVVVIGHHAEAIREAVPDDLDVSWVVNRAPATTGPRESLLLAAAKLRTGQAAWFTPVDVPVVGRATLSAVRQDFYSATGGKLPLAALPCFQGQSGHPVLAGPEFFGHLADGESGDRIDAIFTWAKRRLLHTEVDDIRVLGNMNRPSEYMAFVESHGAD